MANFKPVVFVHFYAAANSIARSGLRAGLADALRAQVKALEQEIAALEAEKK
jgi:hypothetical protein